MSAHTSAEFGTAMSCDQTFGHCYVSSRVIGHSELGTVISSDQSFD